MHTITTVSKKAGREDYQIAGRNVGFTKYGASQNWMGYAGKEFVSASRSISRVRRAVLRALGKQGMPKAPRV